MTCTAAPIPVWSTGFRVELRQHFLVLVITLFIEVFFRETSRRMQPGLPIVKLWGLNKRGVRIRDPTISGGVTPGAIVWQPHFVDFVAPARHSGIKGSQSEWIIQDG